MTALDRSATACAGHKALIIMSTSRSAFTWTRGSMLDLRDPLKTYEAFRTLESPRIEHPRPQSPLKKLLPEVLVGKSSRTPELLRARQQEIVCSDRPVIRLRPNCLAELCAHAHCLCYLHHGRENRATFAQRDATHITAKR